MKLFGKQLFNHKKISEPNLYDFAQHGLLEASSARQVFTELEFEVADLKQKINGMDKKKSKAKKQGPEITPKELFKLKTLNDNQFKIPCDEDYLTSMIADMKDRLQLFKKQETKEGGPMWFGPAGAETYGKKEIESIIERLENRRKLHSCLDILEEFPHTSSKKIVEVLDAHTNLRCDTAGQFVPDFPRDATQAMKKYNQMCQDLCGKNTNFYVIAKKKDFEKVPKKRDPILLAQSPFGFFWQILGAWDEEMIYLGDL